MIPENPGIRQFVWEHMNNFNRILQRMKKVGGTFNGKKLVVCAPSAVVVGHQCSYEGRIPDESYVQRIKDWPACRTVTEVWSFLGTCGVLRIFIKDYSKRTRKLVHLTRKDVPFQFGEKEQTAMEDLKDAVITSAAINLALQNLTNIPATMTPTSVQMTEMTMDNRVRNTGSKLKLAPLSDFDGDRTEGRAFLNSCELYI